jgi:hypothetical protein
MPDFVHPRVLSATLLLAGAVAVSSSCAHKVTRVFSPPVVTKAPEPIPAPAEIDAPRAVAFEPVIFDPPRQTDPSARLPELIRSRTPRPPVANAPKPPPLPAENPPVAAPKLAQILTPEEARRNTQDLEQYLERVRRALSAVAGKNLTADQRDIAERVKTYALQAEQAREKDLVTAVNLARRADLLATDLLQRLP